MSGEEAAVINVKLDMILDRLDRMEEDRKDCREHCDREMPIVHQRIDKVVSAVDQMIGAKVNPYWVYAIITVVALVAGWLFGIRGGGH